MFLLRVIAVIITSLVILALTWWGWTSSSSVAWISTSSTATSSAPHNLNEKYTETRLPPVALLDVLAEGDIIKNEFILHQRLDFLGIKSSHVSEDSSFLLAGSTTSPSIELAQKTSSPMKDISLFKQAFRVDDENIESVKNDFHLNEKVFFGGHGEIWLAHKIFAGEVDLNQTYILKRMNLRNRPDILRCALREIYFGELLQHDPRTTHLVAHFLHDNDYWLAFEDEGVSLQQLLYAVSFTATATLLEPSAIWKNLRSSKEGDDSFKSILYQIIKGVENLHSKGILHRDIKPSNLLINAKNKSGDFGGIRLLISDYSSAVSELALRSGLYGVLDESGDDHAQDYPPSVDEESPQYMPPEVTFSCFDFSTKSYSSNRGDNKFNSGVGTHSSSFISPPDNDQQREEEIGEENGSPHNEKCEPIAYDAYRPESYDIWSIGVVFAEMILGTADVFSVDPRTAALIKHRLRNSDLDTLDQTLTLAALADFCIYVPPNSQTSHDTSEANDPSTKRRISRHRYLSSNTACNVHHLAKAIQRRDPLGTGYHSYGIDLLHRMLKWEPSERITLQEALTHAYFVGPYVSPVDGTEHMTAADLQKYDSTPHPSAADVIEEKSLVIKQETSRSTQLLKEREVVSSIGSEVAVTSLVATSNPPFQLTKISADICPAATPEDSISAQRYCELKGVRELIDEAYGSSDNIFDKTILPNFPGRFRHAMNVSWRGNFTNISSPTMQMKPDDATIDVSDDYDTVFKQETEIMFQCQKCQRVFPMWESCHRHVNARNHGTKCDSVSPSTSNISFTLSGESGRKNRNFVPAILPSCLSSHALLDVGYDPSSGWCDLQGRRAYLEDTHAIRFEKEYKFFGVFDGHMGNRASKFVARHLQSLFHILASDATRDQKDFSGGVQHIKFQSIAASKLWLSAFGIDDANDDNTGKLNVQENLFENASLSSDIWKLTTVVNALHMSFVETNRFFERNHGLYPNDLHTGTTATVVLLFPTAIVVGHVGDSRAVICCDRHTDTGRLIALQLTVDHTPYNSVERSRIEALGGKVVNTGEKLRVNGAMAVTRSIGDFPFGSLLTPEPDIVVFHRYDTKIKRQPKNQSNSLNSDGSGQLDPCEMLYTMRTRKDGSISGDMHAVTQQFMVLASDGLFDVMSNDEVVRFVCASIVDIMKDSPTSKVEVDTVMIDESDTGAHEYVLPFNAFHIAAEQLAQEAYLRGSSDNIGVCIINLFEER